MKKSKLRNIIRKLISEQENRITPPSNPNPIINKKSKFNLDPDQPGSELPEDIKSKIKEYKNKGANLYISKSKKPTNPVGPDGGKQIFGCCKSKKAGGCCTWVLEDTPDDDGLYLGLPTLSWDACCSGPFTGMCCNWQ
tara:strand:+ start:5304 stop:5717 length:414 start_codon:yes stop_codon:yes gene_type:complete